MADQKVWPGTHRSADSRARLISSAQHVFASHGFSGASIRAIADHAGLNLSLIYRYFGSKTGLYQAAVLDPLQEFVDDYLTSWTEYEASPHPAERPTHDLMSGLYALMSDNRELVLALIAADTQQPALAGDDQPLADSIGQLLDTLQVVVNTEAERRGYTGINPPMTIRIVFGIAFSLAVLDRWMFPEGPERPRREEIVDEMVTFVVRAMNGGGPVQGNL